MVSEIKGTDSGVVSNTAYRAANVEARGSNAPERTADKAVAPDNVSLTKTAEQLHQLEKAVKAAPSVDSSRVEQVRQSIANGSYHVDNQKLAEKLTAFEAMMQSGKGN